MSERRVSYSKEAARPVLTTGWSSNCTSNKSSSVAHKFDTGRWLRIVDAQTLINYKSLSCIFLTPVVHHYTLFFNLCPVDPLLDVWGTWHFCYSISWIATVVKKKLAQMICTYRHILPSFLFVGHQLLSIAGPG